MIHSLSLYGPEHIKPESITLRSHGQSIWAGTTPGTRKTLKTKWDGNEDFVKIFSNKDLLFFGLADSHYGSDAGRIVVDEMDSILPELPMNPIGRMFKWHYDLDDKVKSVQDLKSIPTATTCITGTIHQETLHWVNTGDSTLFLFRDGTLSLLAQRHSNLFVGTFPEPDKTFHESFLLPNDLFAHRTKMVHSFLILSQLSSLANQNALTRSILDTILARLLQKTGVDFRGDRDQLLHPWHEANTLAFHRTPEWGQIKLNRNDLILGVTDGVYNPSFPEEKEGINEILKTVEVSDVAGCILKRTLSHGGKDNASLLLLKI